MLTKDEAAKWADALESEKRGQCYGSLCNEGGRVCSLEPLHLTLGTCPVTDQLMDTKVALRIGLDAGFFTQLNDDLRYDFHQIAKLVRQRYQVAAE